MQKAAGEKRLQLSSLHTGGYCLRLKRQPPSEDLLTLTFAFLLAIERIGTSE
jgi:hypothetical protein